MHLPGQMTIRLDAVLHAVQLPASISHLDSGLADMHRNTFPHDDLKLKVDGGEKVGQIITFY